MTCARFLGWRAPGFLFVVILAAGGGISAQVHRGTWAVDPFGGRIVEHDAAGLETAELMLGGMPWRLRRDRDDRLFVLDGLARTLKVLASGDSRVVPLSGGVVDLVPGCDGAAFLLRDGPGGNAHLLLVEPGRPPRAVALLPGRPLRLLRLSISRLVVLTREASGLGRLTTVQVAPVVVEHAFVLPRPPTGIDVAGPGRVLLAGAVDDEGIVLSWRGGWRLVQRIELPGTPRQVMGWPDGRAVWSHAAVPRISWTDGQGWCSDLPLDDWPRLTRRTDGRVLARVPGRGRTWVLGPAGPLALQSGPVPPVGDDEGSGLADLSPDEWDLDHDGDGWRTGVEISGGFDPLHAADAPLALTQTRDGFLVRASDLGGARYVLALSARRSGGGLAVDEIFRLSLLHGVLLDRPIGRLDHRGLAQVRTLVAVPPGLLAQVVVADPRTSGGWRVAPVLEVQAR